MMRRREARSPTHRKRHLTRTTLLCLHLVTATLAMSLVSCRITTDDVHAWAKKSSGPRKLVAVVQHDRYPQELRVEAAVTLVTMPPRGGHALGLLGNEESVGLLNALKEMNETSRASIVDGLVPHLEKGMLAPLEKDGTDASFPYKDAAFALLQHGDGGLVSNPQSQARLKAALIRWGQSNFVVRMDDTAQLHGMEQILRFSRADGVRGLTPLIEADFKKLRQLASLIKELGDDKTKLDASRRMVNVARFVGSDAWVKKKTPAVQEANKTSGLTVSKKQLEGQLLAFQAEELERVFGAMKSIGQKPIVDYFLAYASDPKNPEKRRATALAGLEGHLDRKNPTHAKAMLDLLASDTTPDVMRDVAARRIGELSREQVAERLFSLFDHERWQLRWTVASLVLKMSEKKHIPEFMERLGKIKDMAITEPFSYGRLLSEIKGFESKDLITEYTKKSFPPPVRLSALGYYYDKGTTDDLTSVKAFKSDPQEVPSCREDAKQCAWDCTVVGKNQTTDVKTVKTVGDFVEFCLVPAMEKRKPVALTPMHAKTKASEHAEKK